MVVGRVIAAKLTGDHLGSQIEFYHTDSDGLRRQRIGRLYAFHMFSRAVSVWLGSEDFLPIGPMVLNPGQRIDFIEEAQHAV
jgi:hypothetical protein